MIQNALFKELVDKAKACESGNIVAIGVLFNFLDENAGLSLYEAVSHELTLREQNLTDKERNSLRELGISFYDESESAVDYLVQHKDDDGLPSNT